MRDDPCSRRCGYFSHGQDLTDHERYEHEPCTDCGNGTGQDLAVYGLSHKPDCPRLQPGYRYPAGPATEGATP